MTTDTKLAPTDAEIDAIVYEQTGFDGDGTQPMTADEMRRVTRAVLARWGQPAHSGEPVAWKHDCAALLTNDVELWIDACPHCGKPRNAPQPVERGPLPSVEIMRIVMGVEQQHNFLRGTTNWATAVGRAVERAHGIGGQHGTE